MRRNVTLVRALQMPIELRPSTLIRACSDDTWEPDETGFDALLMPVHGLGGDLIDVVAWRAERPAKWWLRYRAAAFAGEHALFNANREGRPVFLASTPRSYLRQWGHAMVILDWSADVKAIVGSANRGIICENTALAERVRDVVDRLPSERLQISTAAA